MLQTDLPDNEGESAKVMKRITHFCMDRPAGDVDKSKEYVQPQYIVDSINNLFLLPTKPYQPGIVSDQTIKLIQYFLYRLLRHICLLSSTMKLKAISQIVKERSIPWLESSRTLLVQPHLETTIRVRKRARVVRKTRKVKPLQVPKKMLPTRVILTLVRMKRAHQRSYLIQTRRRTCQKPRKVLERRLKQLLLQQKPQQRQRKRSRSKS